MKTQNNQLRLKRLKLTVANPLPTNDLYPDTGESGDTYDLEYDPSNPNQGSY